MIMSTTEQYKRKRTIHVCETLEQNQKMIIMTRKRTTEQLRSTRFFFFILFFSSSLSLSRLVSRLNTHAQRNGYVHTQQREKREKTRMSSHLERKSSLFNDGNCLSFRNKENSSTFSRRKVKKSEDFSLSLTQTNCLFHFILTDEEDSASVLMR